MKGLGKFSLIAVSIVLSACTSKLDGTYKGDMQGQSVSYVFSGDEHVTVDFGGSKIAATYKLDGNRIVLAGEEGKALTRLDDNTLEGPLGTKFIRQK